MYITAFPSVAGRSRVTINENMENTETSAKKICFEQRFAEHDLCPFVSKKIKNNALVMNLMFFY